MKVSQNRIKFWDPCIHPYNFEYPEKKITIMNFTFFRFFQMICLFAQGYFSRIFLYFKFGTTYFFLHKMYPLATLYVNCTCPDQKFWMPPNWRILNAEKKSMLINPDLYVKTTYLNFSQRLSTFINVYCCKGHFLVDNNIIIMWLHDMCLCVASESSHYPILIPLQTTYRVC